MKNLSLLTICVLFSLPLIGQSGWCLKAGLAGGAMSNLSVSQYPSRDNLFGNQYHIRPTIGVQYLKPSTKIAQWGVEANLLWHAFDFTAYYGGLGQGTVAGGNVNLLHLQTSLIGTLRLGSWIKLKAGIGCLTRLAGSADGTVAGVTGPGGTPSPSTSIDVTYYFNSFLFVPTLALVFPVKHLVIELQVGRSLNKFEKLEEHDSSQASMITEQLTIGYRLSHE